jgi:hypothetical protein
MKCAHSSGISSRRSDNARRASETIEPVVEIRAERAAANAFERSRWVAEMMRASIGTISVEPTGRTLRPCRERNSLACRRRHVADLIEEQRAALGCLE